MRKIYSSLAILFISLFAMSTLTSCESKTETETHAYAYGVSQSHSSKLGDLTKITNYLKSKQCLMEAQIFSAKSLAETDEMAAKFFKEHASKISVAEIQELGLDKGTSFTYSASRYVDPSNPKSEIVIVASFKYPAN